MAISHAKVKWYFKPPSVLLAFCAIFFGSLFLWCGIDTGNWLAYILGFLLFIGLFRLYARISSYSAAELDEICKNFGIDIKQKALNKLEIDEESVSEASPLFFVGYSYDNMWGNLTRYEGIYRSTICEASVFLFSSEQVFYYRYQNSLLDGSSKESTEEYFYSDIVTLETASDSDDRAYLKLTTTGGSSISARVKDVEEAQKAIRGVKHLMRQRKTSQ